MTRSTLESKYRKNVRGESSTCSTMSSIVVSSNPRSANSRNAASESSARDRSFFRSLRPIDVSTGTA
jgi:hypothetical protein